VCFSVKSHQLFAQRGPCDTVRPTNGTIADGFSPRPADPIHSTRWNAEEFFNLTHLEAGRNGRRHVQAGTFLPAGRWRCGSLFVSAGLTYKLWLKVLLTGLV